MALHFNPSDIQTLGVGLAAFLSILLTLFVAMSAGKEKLGRALWITLACTAVWSSFGFLYQIVPGLSLPRELRIVSVAGIVWLSAAQVNFSSIYLEERAPLSAFERIARACIFSLCAVFTGLLASDLFGSHFVVGDLLQPSNIALAPQAGPFMGPLIVYFAAAIMVGGVYLAHRARIALDKAERRQAEVLFASVTLSIALGGVRFTPWYGFVYPPLLGDIAFPVFVFGVLYAMQRYRLLNVEVAVSQLLIFGLWTFSFFRMLLEPTLRAAAPDIGLFTASVILGILLLRSVIREAKAQRELAALTIDRARSEFVTIAAHQLRTPLAALRWTFDLLMSGTPPLSASQQQVASRGLQAADNMMALVNDLLNVARMSHGSFVFKLREDDVEKIARASLDELKEAAGKKQIHLAFDAEGGPFMARVDAPKLSLALENVIDNAVKYTPVGGTVTVGVSREGALVIVTVRDTGIGISKQDQQKLFEKFFRSETATRMFPNGSGLGLYIAKTIAEGQGGILTLASAEGQGTSVTLQLPASSGSGVVE